MTRMQRPVHVVGVGMIPFTKPGQSDPYTVMGARAARLALEDAGVDYAKVEQAYVGYVYGDSTAGQAAIYGVGLTGIPVFNVNNHCSTGSSALFLARQAVESGMVECAIALGFEQMQPGALKGAWDDRPSPMTKFAEAMTEKQGFQPDAPRAVLRCCSPACPSWPRRTSPSAKAGRPTHPSRRRAASARSPGRWRIRPCRFPPPGAPGTARKTRWSSCC